MEVIKIHSSKLKKPISEIVKGLMVKLSSFVAEGNCIVND